MSDRPAAADDIPPLIELPLVYDQLLRAVRSRRTSTGVQFGAAFPIRLDVMARLYAPDHLGHLGIVPGIAALEHVARLALGDSLPDRGRETEAVRRACRYLEVQSDRMLTDAAWTPAATEAVEALVDDTLSRIDAYLVRRQWESMRKDARKQLDDIDGTIPDNAGHLGALEAARTSCLEVLEVDYIDYEGELFDSITHRYTVSSSYDWYGLVQSEVGSMIGSAKGLLGLSEHSQRRMVVCPMCTQGQIGLTPDPEIAACDRCGRQWALTEGLADAYFRAWREAGWRPQHVA